MPRVTELGTVLIRIVVGVTFFMHGLAKFTGGLERTVEAFEGMGLPGLLAYVIAAVELVGGMCMMLGLGTKLAAAAFSFVMVGAITMVKLKMGFLGGFEFDLALLIMSIHLFLNEKQTLAIDNIKIKKN